MNKNIWNLYKTSDRGIYAIKLFTLQDGEDEVKWAEQIFQTYIEYLSGEQLDANSSTDFVNNSVDDFCLAKLNILADDLQIEENENWSDYFDRLIDNIELSEIKQNSDGTVYKEENCYVIVHKQDYKRICDVLPEISLALFVLQPNAYFPMLFREQFDVFIKILDVLNIPMPELPSKSDKRGRLIFYNNLVDNIIEFSKTHNLTLAETCACIYDFAFILLAVDESDTEMPEPTNIWLTGGSKHDYKTFLENPVKGAKSVWTCNENTKRGDIIIMYVLAPYSCIQSVWRADIDGVFTPFNYYNSRTRATNGIIIPQITINELKEDPYFSQLGIVRKNFQGVNGVRLSVKDYNELQRILTEKNFNVSVLPQLYKPNLEIDVNIKNEKDVEEKLLIPLLNILGFSSAEWSRQLSQKAGRNLKAIPDFVFLPKGEMHFQNAPMIIEAKFDMSSNIEKTKTYNQALSYARLMNSSIFGICDKERLIIYKQQKGHFNRFEPTFEKHWQSINDAETFRFLKGLIGKEALK